MSHGSTSEGCLTALRERGVMGGRLLVCAPAGHAIAPDARARGFEVRESAWADAGPGEPGPFDAVVVVRPTLGASDFRRLLEGLGAALRPHGVLLLTVPRSEAGWPTAIHGVLLKAGFHEVWLSPEPRLRPRAEARVVCARLAPRRPRPLCSVLVPVYNELSTVTQLLESLLAKQIPGADKEVIVVESNSTDGTRELVSRFQQHAEIRILHQDRPRGKGNAVRLALAAARGDVVLIQDADLEYDLEDYETLLRPLLSYEAGFVLGSRHAGSWKIRDFSAAKGWAVYLNLGHLFFTWLINVLYGQRLHDPFTMYKVFWRDCTYGMDLECDGFDFDLELLIKLIRKGYRPLELPVSYRSRGFRQGKKIRPFRDPWSWLFALVKYRLVPLRHRAQSPSGGGEARLDLAAASEGSADP